ncbi:MAG TPA: ribonuclease J [Gaiellales bacterium]|jgi:ribonuclease J
MSTRDPVRIIPLGGLGEVGKNMTVVECGGDLILIDAGLTFPKAEMHGIDLVLPDFAYVVDRADRLRAVVLTHGHEDHVGALPYLLRETGPGPVVYGTRLTLGLVKSRLDEHGLGADTELVEVVPDGSRVRVGPFDAEFVRVTHSIPDAVAVVLHTEHGPVVHTGDFKLDMTPVDGRPVDIERLRALGDEGVTLLMSDSTNAENPGTTPSEMTVGPSMRRIIGEAPGRVIVTSFASQIHRLQQVIDAAAANRRRVCVIGRSMVRNLNISRNLGYAEMDDDIMLKPRDLDSVLPHEVVVLCTGSQGEPRSALTRISLGDHPALQIHPTDTVVMSSKAVPGNEVNVGETVNRLNRMGATVLTENNAYVHVSGHGSSDELRTMLELVRPRHFVPVHGEYRMLRAHARIAEQAGVEPHAVRIADNGTVLELDGEGLFVTGQIETGMTLVDGYSVGDVRDEVLRDRRRLATDGVLIVVATIAAGSAEVVVDPEVIARGFEMPDGDGQELLDASRDAVDEVLERCLANRITEPNLLQQELHDALAPLVHKMTGKRPMVLPVVVEV